MSGDFWAKTVIRTAAALLCAGAIQSVRADIPAYQGGLALKRGDRDSATVLMKRAFASGNRTPDFLLRRAEMLEAEAVARNNLESAKESLDAFRMLRQQMPFSGKIRLQTARAEIRVLEKKSQLNRESWEPLEKELYAAQAMQRGSSWTAYKAGETLLKYQSWLSNQEREKAYRFLRQAAQDQPEHYLEAVLKCLKDLRVNESFLKASIPETYETYRRAASFFQENADWKRWEWAYEKMRIFRQEKYAEHSDAAEAFAEKKQWKNALSRFDEALWLDSTAARAKAGKELCSFHLENKDFKPAEEWIEKALEEGEPLGRLPFFLRAPDAPSLGNYLKGLLELSLQNPESAYDYFKNVSGNKKHLRYYTALTLLKKGEKKEALEILNLGFEKKEATLRELLLFQELNPARFEEIQQRIKTDITKSQPSSRWEDKESQKGRLHEGQKTGALVALLPGKVHFSIAIRTAGGKSEEGALIIRLGDRVIGNCAVLSPHWHSQHFETEVQGGKYWLSVERVVSPQVRNPEGIVEVGGLKIFGIKSGTKK